ncbi:hypothetical protein GON26_19845 [Flavobacterium sp. GA093]|uniref:Uncharacterized protein n=2 Tax=Flavobacterium hydrocarbonoxydans TaxID=2683249 RepID=A0A6I4NU61_9FLAO|nr:hypothetical protein [Flavobacterium hydrocarbonoxydans]
MQKKFNTIPSINEVVAFWYVLQHLRGYKPFLTKLRFEKKFSGNLQRGKAEIEQEKAQKKAQEDLEWERQYKITNRGFRI